MTLSNPSVAVDAPLLVVRNTASGSHDGDDAQQRIGAVFDAAGRPHAFFGIDALDQALREAQARKAIVVACGGDGTLNAVAQRVLPLQLPFGVIPQGTFNYFARVHGISQDAEAAARALLSAVPTPVQVGLVNDRVFLVNASLGLYPELLEEREQMKSQLGRTRMIAFVSALRTLLRERRQLRLRIEREGANQALRTPTLFIGNNRLQLDRLGFTEADALDRGQLAAIWVRPIGSWAMMGLALRGALGRLGEAENVESFAIRRITVWPHRQHRIKVATDGEIHQLRAPLEFRVSPQPLLLMVPSEADRVEVR